MRTNLSVSTILLACAVALPAVDAVDKQIPRDNGFSHDFGKVTEGDFLVVNVSPESGWSIWNNHVRNPRESGWRGGPRFTYTVPQDFTANNGLFRGNYGRDGNGGAGGTAPEWNGAAAAAGKVLRPGSPQVDYSPVDLEALAYNEELKTDAPAPQTKTWTVRYQDNGDQGQDTATVAAKLLVRVRALATVHRPWYDIFGSGEAAAYAVARGEGDLIQEAKAGKATSFSTPISIPLPPPLSGSIPIPVQSGNGTDDQTKPDVPWSRTLGQAVSHAPRSQLGPYRATMNGITVAQCKILVNLAIRAEALANVQILDNSAASDPETIAWDRAE